MEQLITTYPVMSLIFFVVGWPIIGILLARIVVMHSNSRTKFKIEGNNALMIANILGALMGLIMIPISVVIIAIQSMETTYA